MKKIFIYSGLMSVVFVVVGCGAQQEPSNEVDGAVVQDDAMQEYIVDAADMLDGRQLLSDIERSELSSEEKEDLTMMREEEKLAYDVYTTLYEKWDQRIFTNIASSEKTHTTAVKTLLDRYEIEDPVTTQEVGVYSNDEFTSLYETLVEKGSQSLEEALIVGATIEDLDIKDLQVALTRTDNADIQRVYENLMRGSRNHIRAFTKQLERNGGTYEAQYLSQEEIDTILAGDQERGSGGGQRGEGGGRRGR